MNLRNGALSILILSLPVIIQFNHGFMGKIFSFVATLLKIR